MSKEQRKERFRRRTSDALLICAKWLEEHADELTDRFADESMGCKSWSLSFTFDPDNFPVVIVDTDCKHVAVVDGAYD